MSEPNTFRVFLSEQYTESVSKYQREQGISYEIFQTLLFGQALYSIYRFGSSIEGTEIKNSDLDMVICHETATVVKNLAEAPSGQQLAAMIIDCAASPGYVKLQVVVNRKPLTDKCPEGQLALKIWKFVSLDGAGRVLLSDFASVNSIPTDVTKTGPALTSDDFQFIDYSKPTDYVLAVPYKGWPQMANEWIVRKREHEWPSKSTMERFQKLGCFLVRVGSPGSNEFNFEWRISFSLQEREIMFGLNNVQHTCYIILKWIKQGFLNNRHGKPISSYHCKTCLFYMIERNPQNIWTPENLLNCVIGCLNILQECVVRRNCPNYFVSKENMFTRVKDDGVWQNVSAKLQKLIDRDVNIVIDYERYQFGHININPDGPSSRQLKSVYASHTAQIFVVLSYSFEILRRFLELDKKPKTFVYNNKLYIKETINALKQQLRFLQNTNTVTEHTSAECKAAIDCILPFLYTSLGSHLAVYSRRCENNSEAEEYKTLAEKHFNMGVLSDLTSGRLKQISFMYIRGQYNACLEELTSLEQINWINVTNISGRSVFQAIHTFNQNKLSCLEVKHLSSTEFFQSFCSASMIFSPTEVDLMPFALQIELFRTVAIAQKSEMFCDFVFLDSQIYLYFLLYLISKKMNKSRRELLSIIHQMENILSDMQHVPTALNLIAWALAEEGCMIEAMKYFAMSWNYKPNRVDYVYQQRVFTNNMIHHPTGGNSAIWHILLLLRRIWLSDIISRVETLHGVYFCFNCLKEDKVSMQKCSKCKIARYCSRHCQEGNWKVHRKFCKMLS